jgi:hypothetical protein
MPAELLQLGRIRLQGEFRGKKHGEADRGRTAIIGFSVRCEPFGSDLMGFDHPGTLHSSPDAGRMIRHWFEQT